VVSPPGLWFHLPVQCPHCAGTVPLRFERIVAGGPARTSTTYAAECASCHASVRATIDGAAPVADVLLEAARASLDRARNGGGSHG
jgi:hypothetical protein